MVLYLIRRLILAAAVMLVAISVLFCLVFVVPGDPASVALGPRATEAQKQALRGQMGLDQPAPVQMGRFIARVVQGDLGEDVLTHRPVNQLIARALPNTLLLALSAIAWAMLLGIPLGCYAALRQNGWGDKLIGVVSIGVISLPAFVVAIYAMLVFSVTLRWFPAIGGGRVGDIGSQFHALVLPALTVSLSWVGYLARLVRASMLEVLKENHIRTYRAFGISDARIVLRYALPIAVVPVVSVLGVGMGSLLSGAVLTEIVFARPGLGKLAYDSVISRNFPVVMGTVVITSMLYVLANLIADLLNTLLDPRTRQEMS
ncbi:ABC transporter permease [Biostraticola tofi]|uniref:Peptide/nickel transport system permease protein n=1 Tax=Biostraticola tofi TaxID=466109 RepID=A0A4R3YYR5_9GAMM|nr:ABC transporter permease [Biostraticola tofi]TCV98385.1 peptide/nickel transport system permease protein [Biostraticola tofi]